MTNNNKKSKTHTKQTNTKHSSGDDDDDDNNNNKQQEEEEDCNHRLGVTSPLPLPPPQLPSSSSASTPPWISSYLQRVHGWLLQRWPDSWTAAQRRNYIRRAAAVLMMTLIMGGGGYIHYRGKQRRLQTENDRRASDGIIAVRSVLLPLLLQYWRRLVDYMRRPASVSYRSATEAPLSLLYHAAKEGRLAKVLFGASGSNVVYYLLSSSSSSADSASSKPEKEGKQHLSTTDTANTTWRRSQFPADLQTELWHLLSSTATSSTNTEISTLPESWANRLATPVLAALPFVYLAFLYRMMKNLNASQDQLGEGASMMLTRGSDNDNSHRSVTFRNVAGLDHVVVEVAEVVSYLRDPAKYQRRGARAPRAVLLHGPPGSGKTLLAQAVAGEAAVDAFCVCSAASFVEVYVGRGAARVRHIFADLRQRARRAHRRRCQLQQQQHSQSKHLSALSAMLPEWMSLPLLSSYSSKRVSPSPSLPPPTAILFLDELDALAKTRSQWTSNDEREQTLNQLLIEMDGSFVQRDNATIRRDNTEKKDNYDNDDDDDDVILIVMAASNRVDVLDPAILRRFERQIYVGYPDAAGRQAMLQMHAQRIPCVGSTGGGSSTAAPTILATGTRSIGGGGGGMRTDRPDGSNSDDEQNELQEIDSDDENNNNNNGNSPAIDWSVLAQDEHTGGFSGADIRNLINEAALLAVREGARLVQHHHLEHAARRIRYMKQQQQRQSSSSSALVHPLPPHLVHR